MPHLVLAFDPSTSISVCSQADGVEELPFPVAALMCSLRSYSEQSGWLLQDIQLDDCTHVYHKGNTGLLWMMVSNKQLLDPQYMRNMLQVADAMAEMLLGKALCSAGHTVLKRQFKGIASSIDQLFQPNMQLTCPLTLLLLPHQTLLQPSAAAVQLPRMLEQVCAATPCPATSAAALLHNGWYCCASPRWQSMGSLQLLVLQLTASAVAAAAAAACPKHGPAPQLQVQYSQLALHSPAVGGTAAPDDTALRLLVCNLQPHLQLCLITSSSYTKEQFAQSVQQQLTSQKPCVLEVQQLVLPYPLLAVAVADTEDSWATCNTAPGHEQISPYIQVALSLSQRLSYGSILAHTGGKTVATLPVNSNSSTMAIAVAAGHLDLGELQQLVESVCLW